MANLRISTTEEVPLQASKWQKSPVLLDLNEMEALFNALGEFHLFFCSGIVSLGAEEMSREVFFEYYGAYINSLKEGLLPDPAVYRRWFSLIMTRTPDAVYVVPCGEGRVLVRAAHPIIQMQAHDINYSAVDGKFRSLVFGPECIAWGIQFSFPLLYRDETTHDIEQTRHSPELPNVGLFQALQRWMRSHTAPASFEVAGAVQAVPIRIGRHCLPWINCHAQLKKKEINCL